MDGNQPRCWQQLPPDNRSVRGFFLFSYKYTVLASFSAMNMYLLMTARLINPRGSFSLPRRLLMKG